jgi:hypothetical protein
MGKVAVFARDSRWREGGRPPPRLWLWADCYPPQSPFPNQTGDPGIASGGTTAVPAPLGWSCCEALAIREAAGTYHICTEGPIHGFLGNKSTDILVKDASGQVGRFRQAIRQERDGIDSSADPGSPSDGLTANGRGIRRPVVLRFRRKKES